MSSSRWRSLPPQIVVEILQLAAVELLRHHQSFKPLRPWAALSRNIRQTLWSTPSLYALLTCALPDDGDSDGRIESHVLPRWPRGLTPSERENVLEHWVNLSRTGRTGGASIDALIRGPVGPSSKSERWGADPDNTPGPLYPSTLLNVAAASDYLSLAKTLLDLGAHPDQRYANPDHSHRLHPATFDAVEADNVGVLALLLDRGADLELTWTSYHTPLARAAAMNAHRCVKLLLDRGANALGAEPEMSPLAEACTYLAPDSIRVLLEASRDDPASFAGGDPNGPLSNVMYSFERQGCRPELLERAKRCCEVIVRHNSADAVAALEFWVRMDDADGAQRMIRVGANPTELDDRWIDALNAMAEAGEISF
ncbi:hypothetical protein DFJ73DRAFT_944039 [Zopfochytrium polystomum]|nr:hypothetical protein DFJ73DRAFT_944039 [Zopfochytrium polystomum]